tara:strand:+ start:392 stop:571 length:180 start_codon:yes stop_codon:yes gene_type:complete
MTNTIKLTDKELKETYVSMIGVLQFYEDASEKTTHSRAALRVFRKLEKALNYERMDWSV